MAVMPLVPCGSPKKQRAPDCQQRADPAKRRPDPEQNQTRKRKAADKRIALGMDRRNLRADGIGDGHQVSLVILPLSPCGRGWRAAKRRAGRGVGASEHDSVENAIGVAQHLIIPEP